MRCLILMLMIFLSSPAIARAEGFFEYQRIYFFDDIYTKKETAPTETSPASMPVMDEWAEPIVSPTGEVSIYLPPKQVRDFLKDPTPESAKAYLEWNTRRIKKFSLARQLLAQEAAKLELKKDTAILDTQGNYLAFFMLKGCPLCEREVHVLEDIYLTHPEIKIEAFASGFSDEELAEFGFPARQDAGISQVFKIESYPTVLVFNKNKRRYLLSGYADKDKILRLLE